jgi:hypothetical protein
MSQCRIKFYKVKGIFSNKEYIETYADSASHYRVFKNCKFMREFTKIKKAIDYIIELEGPHIELDNLSKNIRLIQNPGSPFATFAVSYTPQHGVRIEQKIRV